MKFLHRVSSFLFRWVLPATASALSLISVSGCNSKPHVAADQPVPVRLRLPKRFEQPVSVSASGSVEANVTSLTTFQVAGRVAHVYVDEGQYVKQGQVLADLDQTDYRNAFEAAQGHADAGGHNPGSPAHPGRLAWRALQGPRLPLRPPPPDRTLRQQAGDVKDHAAAFLP